MKKHTQLMLEILGVLAGTLAYAFGISVFVGPAGLITGGITGLGLLVERLSGFSMSTFVLIVNTGLFILGFFVLGKRFAATTALSTFLLPVALEMFDRFWPAHLLTQDPMLSAIFGGLSIGVSIGVTMRVGASTGGLDIPALILNKFFRIPVAPTLYFLDMIILLTQALHASWEQILYGVLLVILYTLTLNRMLTMGKRMIELKIISEKVDDIRKAILSQVDRGGTLLKSRTGYRLQDTEVLLSVISTRELNRTEKLIHQIDPHAFIIIDQVTEVSGRGFTMKKQYLKDESPEKQPD
ncbi:MAG: YitT family protein [Clostridiales bacterium]|nr:YitT family protein [Clostridiales bacterium]